MDAYKITHVYSFLCQNCVLLCPWLNFLNSDGGWKIIFLFYFLILCNRLVTERLLQIIYFFKVCNRFVTESGSKEYYILLFFQK